jgi:hypothetical protein
MEKAAKYDFSPLEDALAENFYRERPKSNTTPAHPLVHSALQLVKSTQEAFYKAQLAFATQLNDNAKKQAIALIAKRKIEVAKAYVQLNMAYDKTSKKHKCVCCEGYFAESDVTFAVEETVGVLCPKCFVLFEQELEAPVLA